MLLAAIAVGAIVVAPVMAQDSPESQDLPDTDLSASAKATPSKAGTKSNPQGATITASAKIVTEPGFDPPIVTGVDLLVGKGLSWNGGNYVQCSKRALDREGPKGCPKESIMGNAIATARADTVNTHIDIVFVNAGSKRLFAYATLENPARVQETVVVKTTNMTGQWHYKDSFRVPKSLQVVAGVPIQVTGIKLKLGGKPYAKGYITSTSCPKGGWKYRATAHYLFDLSGQTTEDTTTGTISCTP
ncbi:MAG TPA: hypothetical protein VI111_00810 [Thermoleophilaceae bacterium]